jgi:hypothetical protein
MAERVPVLLAGYSPPRGTSPNLGIYCPNEKAQNESENNLGSEAGKKGDQAVFKNEKE